MLNIWSDCWLKNKLRKILDNDIKEETLDGKKTTLATTLAVFQKNAIWP